MVNRFFIFSFVCMATFIGWIISQANAGSENFFIDHLRVIPYGDKLGHVGLYWLLALLLNLALGLKSIKCGWWQLQLGSVLVLGFAVIEEMTQGFLVMRSLDFWDIVADLVGIAIAGGMVARISRWINGGSRNLLH